MSEADELQPITVSGMPVVEDAALERDWNQIVRSIACVVGALALVVIAVVQIQSGRREAQGLCAQRVLYERSTASASNPEVAQRKVAACFD